VTSPTAAPLDISGALRVGWRGFVANIIPLVVIGLVVWLVTGALNLWGNQTTGTVQTLLGLVSFFVGQLVAIVWIAVALAILDGREISSDTVMPSGATFVSYVVASFLFSLMLAVGFVLLVIPGIIVALAFGLFGWALVDKDLDPIEALRHSAQITRGHRWQLFGFVLVAILLNILGLLLLVVGVLVTSAVTLIAAGHIYRQLDGSLRSTI
jgi:uncharacterized membrane protein